MNIAENIRIARENIARAAIAGHLLNMPMGYVRGSAKEHGRNNRIEGKLEAGQKVVVVEDLISTGGSCIDVVDALREAGAEVEIIFANDCRAILPYTKNVLNCDIHTRVRTKRLLTKAGAERVFGLDELLTESIDGSGWNARYGLLGSNKATEDTVKLFPREECQQLVEDIQAKLLEVTGKHIEVMIYGDGAFKDPIGKIWELADPVVSPAYTAGLEGTPNELKLKYLADNDFSALSGKELQDAIKNKIMQKDGSSLVGNMVSQGTTPRRLTDLIGSLCDLTSGSGDKGTPIVYIQGYFDNYTND